MNKKGITLVEFVVSIALVSIVLIFLFNLMLDVQYSAKSGDFARENQLNRGSIMKTVMDDFSNLGLIGMKEGVSGTDHLVLIFRYRNGSEKTLTVYQKYVTYGDERWSLRSSNTNANYQVRCIPYQYINNVCQNGNCSDYFSIRIRIPIVITNQKENTMDDLDFFYIGKSSDLGANAFPSKSFLGYSSNTCSH